LATAGRLWNHNLNTLDGRAATPVQNGFGGRWQAFEKVAADVSRLTFLRHFAENSEPTHLGGCFFKSLLEPSQFNNTPGGCRLFEYEGLLLAFFVLFVSFRENKQPQDKLCTLCS